MAKPVKPAGQNSMEARGRTHHGSPFSKRLSVLGGKIQRADQKPRGGFLSRPKGPQGGRPSGKRR